ncbi:MAG: nucleoside monophosphate kinase [Patescibacteria group bacterium]
MASLVRNILILGPQGSGKGTQAGLLAGKLKLAHIETGKMFRRMAKRSTPLGRRINRIMNEKGKLIPDALANRILWQALKKVRRSQGIVFDGFPRTLAQARTLDRLMKRLGRQITLVINMPISRRTTIRRLSLRRTCDRCGRIFIAGKNISPRRVTCPVCGGKIFQREDDKPAAIAGRLAAYRILTKPVIRYYRDRHVLLTVDGEPPVQAVFKNILKLFT